ncbi:hypothetical protein B0I35DRAFT_415878 [Stachybotrys elegans]|uniref:Uncharacterized protein n=1 Tax=Stachybotrys elegans TaxID=80388 RepID=A0A8K0WW59_9HYPO|nr:hypothetical protein B0I35DRAFT_415878 [Stachybotrys elegans]
MAEFPGTAAPPTSFHNVSSWYNLTAWTVNVTRYAPIFEDIVWAGPRIFMKLGSFISHPLPLDEQSTQATQYSAGASVDSSPIDLATLDDHGIYKMMEPGVLSATSDEPASQASNLASDGSRGLGSIFSYATSKWAISCIVMAIVLNRTHIFAATRRRSRFSWHVRFLLRLVPLVMLILQARDLLQSIQCQTSADFSQLRWGNATRSSDLMFSHANGLLNTISSVLLFGYTDKQSCLAVQMIPASDLEPSKDLRGSLSLLWPLFGTFCLSHFVETLSCAVQGRPLAAETGMTLFEQSLAFAEADAAVSNQLAWGSFTKSRSSEAASSPLGSTIALTRSMILKRVNTPTEVLLVAFLSSMTHISSHVLAIFDLQAKFRLVNTGFWAFCFMGSIAWSAITFDLDDPARQGLLRFPTVCIIGFLPHALVLAGIAMCCTIYALALLLSALAPPPAYESPRRTFRQRLVAAHENMQANISLSEIRVTREMDFYTALLRTGFAAITMASEAVYLNEDRGISLKQRTWLEEARYREIEEMQRHWAGMDVPSSKYDSIGAIGLIPVEGGSLKTSSGYARERAAQKVPKGRGDRSLRVGVGATERSSRWLLAVEFMLNIHKLIARLSALSILWCLRALRIRRQPAWLLWLARRPKTGRESEAAALRRNATSVGDPLAFNQNGFIPRTDGIDVEAEFRHVGSIQDEDSLDKDLYNYWLKGGWWGSKDSSGDFAPSSADEDWDNTSVVSFSTQDPDHSDEDGWESDGSGQRTPTQGSQQFSRESTPFADSPMNMGDLARLLHPQTSEEKEEARALSAHLQSDGIMTRAKYRRMEQLQRTRILTIAASRSHQAGAAGRNAKLSPEEEELLLEQVLLSRRQASAEKKDGPVQWNQGAAGLGGDGPQCVVCQCSPRTIIVWPCRCLSLCDDCRVSLAMNNFDKCVCCRREVISFSRIFVP